MSTKKSSQSSTTGSQSSSQHSSPEQPTKLSKEERDIIRRRRNVQSAKRSREKRNQEHRLVQLQVLENEDRIRFLETQVSSLTAELTTPRKSSSSSRTRHHSSSSSFQWKQGDRPAWFGDPF